MLDSPVLLILAGLSLAGTTVAIMRRRRRPPAASSLAHLSTGELEALHQSLDPRATTRHVTLLLVEEEIRRRKLFLTEG